MTTYRQSPLNPLGPEKISGPGGNLRSIPIGRDLKFTLIKDHINGVGKAALQVAIKLILVGSGIWRSFAMALHAFLAGLSVGWSYRPSESIPTPAREALVGVAFARNGLGVAARYLSRFTGSHQRFALRTDAYLIGKRHQNHVMVDEIDLG